MTRPIIGITTYGQDEHKRYALPKAYVDCVRAAGGVPVLVPPGDPALENLLDGIHGFILAGGGDLDPVLYGGHASDKVYMIDAERDQSELALTRSIVDQQLPCLAICRGIQVVNVALGGTLIEHLPDEVGEAVLHRAPPREPVDHMVRIQDDSRLAALVGQNTIRVASWHHQAIRAPGRGLRVVAQAPDDTIEAVEMPGNPGLMAVQWHPELTAGQDPLQQKLFENLINAAIKRISL
jgi:putative glutamine amidotransferase